MKSKKQWENLIRSIVFTTKEGKEKKPHTRVQMWDFPHHVFDLETIKDTLERVKNKRKIDQRRSHPLRSLGLLDQNYEITSAGRKILNSKQNRIKKFIIENQCKKWHYPNITLRRASSLAQRFNIFPFWICLSFMLSLKEKVDSDILFKEEAIFTVLSIKDYADIPERLEFLLDFRERTIEEREQILSRMHIKESLDFLYKGACYKLFSAWTRYFLTDSEGNLILNYEIIREASKLVKIFNGLYKNKKLPTWNVKEYSDLLYSDKSFEKFFEGKEFVDVKDAFPDISRVRAEFIDLKIDQKRVRTLRQKQKAYPKIIDFEREIARRKKIGDLGEEIVLKKEQETLKRKRKTNLSNRVKQISKIDISAGYDVLSYELNGKEKYIEVKSTASLPHNIFTFIITKNEYEKAKELKNYYLYIVFRALSKNPKIWRLKSPFNTENRGIFITPASFRVIISVLGITR